MAEGIILKQILKDTSRQLNELMGDVLGLSNIATQLREGCLEAARKLGELATSLYEVSKES